MHRSIALALALAAAVSFAAAASQNPVVGRWDCVASIPGGGESKWTLTVKEDNGKLAGSVLGEEGEMPLDNPKFDNGVLSFSVNIESVTYNVQLKVQDAKLEGSWTGGGDTGSLRGSKAM